MRGKLEVYGMGDLVSHHSLCLGWVSCLVLTMILSRAKDTIICQQYLLDVALSLCFNHC
jgi:hypothetical protein